MVRRSFEHALQQLQDEILLLGSMTEQAVTRSVEALRERNVAMAKQIIADDMRINQKRFAIEDTCVDIIARQQPMARDLRKITAALIIANELERMADHAQGISKINVMMGDEPLLKPLVDIPRMAEKGVAMLVLDYCDACLGPVGPGPYHVTELEFLSDRVLTWDFCSEECLLSGLND